MLNTEGVLAGRSYFLRNVHMSKTRAMMQGVSIIPLQHFSDERGLLVPLEAPGEIPFVPQRVFFIQPSSPDTARGGHALSCHELLMVARGAMTIDLDNGVERRSVRLADHRSAVWVMPGVWLRLCDFAPETLVAVIASSSYSDVSRYNEPKPHLL